ncbi:MAG: DUF4340 domain-containing protein [Ruminococcus sp.]|nr:DUF4340 domain-containing protein [Ruminococcus sp.]
MKKEVKGIIALGGVLAVLGGGLAVMKLTDKSGSESSDSTDTPAVETTTVPSGSGIILVGDGEVPQEGLVSELHVKNSDDEFDIVMIEPPTEQIAAKYSIKGCEDLDIDTGIVATLVNNVNGIQSAGLISENCQDLSKYGLDNPEITAEMTYDSGKKVKYYVGIKNPVDTTKSYFRVEGSNDVYIIENSRVANYYKTVADFISRSMLESPAEDDMPIVESLVLEREDIDYRIVLEPSETSTDSNAGGTSATHEMIEPLSSYLNVEQSSKITHGMFGLTATDVYAYRCTADDLKNAGLDKPFCRTEMKCDDGNDYVLLLSEMQNEEDKGQFCYAMFEDGQVIYTLSADKAPWVTVMPVDIASRIMVGNTVWNITDLSISLSTGEKNVFKLAPIDPAKETNNTAEDFTAELNGEEIQYERFRRFYKYLVSANAEDLVIEKVTPTGEPLAVLEYTDGYVNRDYKFEFYDYSPMTVLVAVNGECRFFGSRAYVDNLIENVRRLETGEEFLTTWK